MEALISILLIIPVFALIAVYAERKISAYIQDREGPLETGPYGLLQTFADIVKLLQKEDIVPREANKLYFKIAPVLLFAAVFAGFAVLPLAPNLVGASYSLGLFYVLGIVSLDVIGILMAGWGSNNKFALYGAIRAVAQIISYEIPMIITVLTVAVYVGSFDLSEMAYLQGITEYTQGFRLSELGGIFSWNLFKMPIFIPVFLIFFIASLAECNRAPFDLPESESELIGGFHTEYSGFRFALIFLSEYGMMLLVSILGTILFLGAWHTPLPNLGPLKLANWTAGGAESLLSGFWGFFWLTLKVLFLIFVQMWVRWTYPRLRVDQLMHLSWKILTPLSLFFLLIVTIFLL